MSIREEVIRHETPFRVLPDLFYRPMNREHLQSHLNDHLAGAMTGFELIDFLISSHNGEASARFFEELRQEIEADRITCGT